MDLNGSKKSYKPTYNWGNWGGARTLCSSPFSSGFPSGKINKHKPNIIDKLQIHEDGGKTKSNEIAQIYHHFSYYNSH